MPLTDRSQAKKGGFQQVREALVKFEGTVTNAEFGQWGGTLIRDDGKPAPPREFLEISCEDVEVLEVTEELSMPIDEWNFRINCSDYEGSFWVDKFLESADRNKIQIPDELIGKRIIWEKVDFEFTRKDGTEVNAPNFVIAEVKGENKAAKPAPKVVSKEAKTSEPEEVTPEAAESSSKDPMDVAFEEAIGKTEAQFRTAITTNPLFINSPLLSMAKAGVLTQAWVNDGKLALVKEGNKEVYRVPD